jgi:soluble lytic murein transglycosylase-like protein
MPLKHWPFLPVIVAFLLASLAAPAGAQIYAWQKADGRWMYSDEPPRSNVSGFRVIGTSFRATRAADSRFANSYDRFIEKYASHYQVSSQLVRAVIQVESGFNPRTVSAKGAMGLMQLMPATAIEMGVSNPFDPEQNIRGGVAYLAYLLNRYRDQRLALAAYNAGPEVVARYGSRVPPFAETRKYVAQVGGMAGGTGVLPSVAQAKAARPAPPAPAPRTPMYKWWEKTPDGRLIQKYGDTKPAKGPYEIVR